MFTDPGHSQWDLNFRLLGIPIRVHPMFWLMSVILGQYPLSHGVEYLFIWVACVFVSILVHEMGHVIAARLFGVDGEIVLYGFGGLAIPAGQMRHRWQHIIVCFAGPLAGFVFLGLVVLCLPALAPEEWANLKNWVQSVRGLEPRDKDLLGHIALKREILDDLFFINLLWGLINLLPIWPLDGGQISRDLFTIVLPRGGASIAFGISLVLCGLLVVNSLMAWSGRPLLPSWVPTGGDRNYLVFIIMFGYLAVGSFMALQEEQARRTWVDERLKRWDPDDDERL
jgi:membrane-associated protease RseP (regulator of RpoE activity)